MELQGVVEQEVAALGQVSSIARTLASTRCLQIRNHAWGLQALTQAGLSCLQIIRYAFVTVWVQVEVHYSVILCMSALLSSVEFFCQVRELQS